MPQEKVKVNISEIVGGGYGNFWRDKHFFRVLKGGRSSKKSSTMGIETPYRIMKYPQSNYLVVRQTGNTHETSTFAEIKKGVERLNVQHLWNFKTNPCEATYKPTGQKILFRGFDDPLKLTSINVPTGVLNWVWIEEAFEVTDVKAFQTLCEGIRGIVPDGLWQQITITYNPWVNSHWTKEMFWDVERPDTFRLTTTHKDNEFLSAEDHERIEALAKTDPERYKVVGLGEYGIPGGAYFNEFRTDIHTIDPFPIPADWRRYIALDYGMDMLACYWIAMDYHNKAYVYKELYKSGLIIHDAAKEILRVGKDDITRQNFGPPDLWNRRQETGKSAAEVFRERGVNLTKANNDRVHGWYNLKEWLRPYEDEQGITTANLVIFKNCTNLIRCLPQVQYDEKDPNDVATEPHELTHSCVTGDTVINTPDGDFKISELVGKSGKVFCYDENKKIKTISSFNHCRMTQKSAPVYKLTFENGKQIRCTSDHKILTVDGWKPISDIKDTDNILSP